MVVKSKGSFPKNGTSGWLCSPWFNIGRSGHELGLAKSLAGFLGANKICSQGAGLEVRHQQDVIGRRISYGSLHRSTPRMGRCFMSCGHTGGSWCFVCNTLSSLHTIPHDAWNAALRPAHHIQNIRLGSKIGLLRCVIIFRMTEYALVQKAMETLTGETLQWAKH